MRVTWNFADDLLYGYLFSVIEIADLPIGKCNRQGLRKLYVERGDCFAISLHLRIPRIRGILDL
jgi:hypothetical protein